MKQLSNRKQILEEAFLPDVWHLVVRFLDSNIGSTTVILAALMTRTYVGPAPFLIISGLIEAGFNGSYFDNLLKKQVRMSAIKGELLPVADAIIHEISKDNLVKSQIAKVRNFARDLKKIPANSKESILQASRNLKNELVNSEKIVSHAIDKALQSGKVKEMMTNIAGDTIYVKRAVMNALTITQSEIKSLLQHDKV